MGYSRRHAGRPVGFLASPRFRRRTGFALAAVVVAGGVAGALIVGNTADPPLPITNRAAIVEKKRKPVRLSAADQKVILAVGRQFVLTAVRRDHAERAWPLASTALRSGTTLADWKAGTLPFAPFPVRSARWARAYSVAGEVGLDVLVESTDPEIRPLVHRLTLVRSRRPSGPAWLVDGWTPLSSAPGGFVDSPPLSSMTDALPVRSTPPPSRLWLLAPFAVLLAALLIPLTILATSRRAERRVRRRRVVAGRQD